MTQPISSVSPRSQRLARLVTVTSAVLAVVTVAAVFLGLHQLSLAGFPDGGTTAYERAAHLPKAVLLWMNLAPGAYLFRLAVPDLDPRTRIVRILYALLMLGLLSAAAEIAVPWYFVDHLGLNDGRGG